MINKRKVEYILKASCIGLAVCTCAVASSYFTYEGLLATQEPTASLMLAVISGLLLVLCPSGLFALKAKIKNTPLRVIFIVGLPAFIFFVSTIWTVVGMAKDEMFANRVQENNDAFIDNFRPTQVTDNIDRTHQLVNKVNDFAMLVEKNAKQGLYSGLSGRGDISRTMEQLHRKVKITIADLNRLEGVVDEDLKVITELTKEMQHIKEWQRREEYLNTIREVNQRVEAVKEIGLDLMINGVKLSVSSASENLALIKEENLRRATSKGIVESEIRTLKGLAQELDELSQRLSVDLPKVSVAAMNHLPQELALIMFFQIYNWWALSLAMDYAPFLLIYLFGTLRNPYIFD